MPKGMTTTRPVTDKGRATRHRILDAAVALAFTRGRRTTLDDVRSAANVSKGQLYHYFADKDDLVHAVIDRTIQQVLDAQPRLINLASWSAIAAWFDDLVQLQVKRLGLLGVARPSAALQASSPKRTSKPARSSPAAMTAGKHHSEKASNGCEATASSVVPPTPRGWRPPRSPRSKADSALTQTRRDPQQLRIALDAAYAYLRSFAA